MTDQRIAPILAQPPCRANNEGLVACGVLAKIRTLVARAQHSALLGLEPLFTTDNL
jgi:hypothetical protein